MPTDQREQLVHSFGAAAYFSKSQIPAGLNLWYSPDCCILQMAVFVRCVDPAGPKVLLNVGKASPVKTDRQNYTKVQYGYGSRASAIPFAIHTLTAAT